MCGPIRRKAYGRSLSSGKNSLKSRFPSVSSEIGSSSAGSVSPLPAYLIPARKTARGSAKTRTAHHLARRVAARPEADVIPALEGNLVGGYRRDVSPADKRP